MTTDRACLIQYGEPVRFRDFERGLFLVQAGGRPVLMVKQWTDGHRPPVVLDVNGYEWGSIGLTDCVVRPVHIVGVLDSLPADPPADLVGPELPEPFPPDAAPAERPDLFTAMLRILGIETSPDVRHEQVRIDCSQHGAAVAVVSFPLSEDEVNELTVLFQGVYWSPAGAKSRRLA